MPGTLMYCFLSVLKATCQCYQQTTTLGSKGNLMSIGWPKRSDARQPHPAYTMHHRSDLKVEATECQRI